MGPSRLSNLSESSRRAALAALASIVVVAMYRWTVAPHLTYLRAVEGYRPVIEKVARQTISMKTSLVTRRRMAEDLQEGINGLLSRCYAPEQTRSLVGELESVVSASGCAVTGLSIDQRAMASMGPWDKDAAIRPLKVDLAVTGDYEGLIALAAAIQGYHRWIAIESMTVEPSGPERAQLQCRLVLVVLVRQKEGGFYHGG